MKLVNLGSVWRGVCAQKGLHPRQWTVRLQRWGWTIHAWTPVWHQGRGPYIVLSLGWLYIARGY